MSWRFLATRLMGNGSEYLIDPDLPLQSPKVTHALSGPGGITASISPEVSRLVGADGNPVFVPWSTAIYAEKNGVIMHGGIITEVSENYPALDIHCTGFSGYLEGMPWIDEFSGYNIDPMSVARMIWNHVQKQPNGNIGFIIDANTSPVRIGKRGHPALRGRPTIYDENGQVAAEALPPQPAQDDDPYVLAWYQSNDLGKEFTNLATSTPFDYIEKHSWLNGDASSGKIQHDLVMRYPSIGRRRDDLRFVLGENVIAQPRLLESGAAYASDVWILGSGEGSSMVNASAADYSQGRLRRVYTRAAKDITDMTVASSMARRELNFLGGTVSFTDLEVKNSPNAPYGDIQVGDWIYVQVGQGWYKKVEGWVRIAELSISPADSETMTMLVMREGADK